MGYKVTLRCPSGSRSEVAPTKRDADAALKLISRRLAEATRAAYRSGDPDLQRRARDLSQCTFTQQRVGRRGDPAFLQKIYEQSFGDARRRR